MREIERNIISYASTVGRVFYRTFENRLEGYSAPSGQLVNLCKAIRNNYNEFEGRVKWEN